MTTGGAELLDDTHGDDLMKGRNVFARLDAQDNALVKESTLRSAVAAASGEAWCVATPIVSDATGQLIGGKFALVVSDKEIVLARQKSFSGVEILFRTPTRNLVGHAVGPSTGPGMQRWIYLAHLGDGRRIGFYFRTEDAAESVRDSVDAVISSDL